MIIGLTGRNAAGKGMIAQYLKEKGFAVHSLSDIIRETAKEEGVELSRENLIRIGNQLRQQQGPGVLGAKTREKLGQKDVADSIRNPKEIEELRKRKDFVLIGVDAPVELRFERAKARGRLENASTLDEFKVMEEKENSSDETAQQLNTCFELADHIIINDGTLEKLHEKIDKLLEEIGDT